MPPLAHVYLMASRSAFKGAIIALLAGHFGGRCAHRVYLRSHHAVLFFSVFCIGESEVDGEPSEGDNFDIAECLKFKMPKVWDLSATVD